MKNPAIRLYEFRIRRRQIRGSLGKHPPGDWQPELLATLFRHIMEGEPRECFLVFHLNIRNRMIGYELVAIGNDFSVTVHPTSVFRGALLSGAAGIIVSHNHPSGEPTPSDDDDTLTERLYAGGKILGVPVVDHVIVTDSKHYSYLQNERFPWNKDSPPKAESSIAH